jgi:hypothetical protein
LLILKGKTVKKILIVFAILALAGLYLWHNSSRHLTFLNCELKWRWQHYWPLDNNKQIARTTDTHQLIMRQVDLSRRVAVFVATTLDSKLDVIVMHQQDCEPGARIDGKLKIKPMTSTSLIQLHCDASGNAMIYRQVWKTLPDIELSFNELSIPLDLSEWNIDELKKDEFMQRHPQFSQRVNADNHYPWSRD